MSTILHGTSPASIATGLLLDALAARGVYDEIQLPGLPGHGVYVPQREAIVAFTSAPPPFFAAGLEALAAEHRLDIVLLRLGDDDAIGADFALGSLPCAVWAERNFALYCDASGSWLVPEGSGPAVSVGPDGFNLDLVPPYSTMCERSAGVERAHNAFVRLLTLEEAR